MEDIEKIIEEDDAKQNLWHIREFLQRGNYIELSKKLNIEVSEALSYVASYQEGYKRLMEKIMANRDTRELQDFLSNMELELYEKEKEILKK